MSLGMDLLALFCFICLQYLYVQEAYCLSNTNKHDTNGVRVLAYARPVWEVLTLATLMLSYKVYLSMALIILSRVFWSLRSASEHEVLLRPKSWQHSLMWLLGFLPYIVGRPVLYLLGVDDDQLQRLQLHADNPFEDLKLSEKKMVRRVLDISRVRVREAMVPLVHVAAISQEADVDEAVRTVRRHGFFTYSRLSPTH